MSDPGRQLRGDDRRWLRWRAVVEGPLAPRWTCWGWAVGPYCFYVHALLAGLVGASSSEPNDQATSQIFRPQGATLVSWLAYPVTPGPSLSRP